MTNSSLEMRGDYMDFVYRFHNTMLEQKLSLVYEGEVNQSITKAFTSLAERNMNGSNEPTTMKRRVYHVMVECLQNICKHADNAETGESERPGSGIFIVGQEGDSYTITTGNVMSKDRIPGLIDLLNKVNEMDRDELKALYKEQMRSARLSDKGGAGLGFIDIAKKTGNDLEYRFEEVNEITSFFMLKTKVSRPVAVAP